MKTNRAELFELIAGGEDSHTEFMREPNLRMAFDSEMAAITNEMIAFANTEGGRILFGVRNDGIVVGVWDARHIELAILTIARDYCTPPIQPVIDHVCADHGYVVAVYVPRRSGPPHENNSGQCYIRVGSTTRLATPQEHARLLRLA